MISQQHTKVSEVQEAMKMIGQYGKSKLAVDAYKDHISDHIGSGHSLSHSLSVAELLSSIAPDGYIDEWYITGLLHDIYDLELPVTGNKRKIIRVILEKSRISPGIISCIENYTRISDLRKWTPLMAALNYVLAHTDEQGYIHTTSECCMKNIRTDKCNTCMYARFYLSQRGDIDRAEEAITKIQKHKDDRNQKEDECGENEKRGVERSLEKAETVFAC